MNYKQYLISKDTKVKDAMKKIDSVKPKILFVVENEKLVGALTDGDVRRYLLAGGKVTDTCLLISVGSSSLADRSVKGEGSSRRDYQSVDGRCGSSNIIGSCGTGCTR